MPWIALKEPFGVNNTLTTRKAYNVKQCIEPDFEQGSRKLGMSLVLGPMRTAAL